MNRIEQLFTNKKCYLGYVTGGDGGLDYCIDCCLKLVEAGVDMLEIGLPFSDPIADGPVIQRASQRALAAQTTPSTLLEIAKGVRKKSDVPLILFTYFNPLFKKGKEYLQELKTAGFDAVLIVDLPFQDPFFEAIKQAGLQPIFMITPSTEEARLAQIAQRAQGFLYYACQKGTTGMKESLPEDFAFHLERMRKHTSLPIVAGFGIASRSSAQEALQCADGFVVGSAIVRKMEERCAPSALKAFAETIDPRQSKLQEKALSFDAADPLSHYKAKFLLPQEGIYLCSNSLGLPPAQTPAAVQEVMDQWKEHGAHGWFHEESDWYRAFDEPLRSSLAKVLGAENNEVAIMNSLTVNLHLLMVSFYQPTEVRYKILIDTPAFPSDLYAVKSHIRRHGFDPETALVQVCPRVGAHVLCQEDVEEAIEKEGDSIALVFINIVNFLNGSVLDMKRISALCKRKGCIVGCDLAHAAGNIPLSLHEDGIDFAVGCSYKYLCSGPGAPGIAFVHAAHHDKELPRYSGWWGNDPARRFDMHLQPEFIPHPGASSWQVSTPCILGLASFGASLSLFKEAGIENLRKKSHAQTAFLLELLEEIPSDHFSIVTPQDPHRRGAQISLLIHKDAKKCVEAFGKKKIIVDFRPPNIVRVTPSPFYTTFQEIYAFACSFKEIIMAE